MPASTGRRKKKTTTKRGPPDAFDPRSQNYPVAVFDLFDAADLLAGQYELQDQQRDRLHHDAVAASADHRQLHADLHRRELVFRLYPLAQLRGDQHPDFDFLRAAGSLRLFALPLPRRQASVLLAAVEPDGAAG